jgi:hypothetical protein
MNRLLLEHSEREWRLPRLLTVERARLAVVEEYIANGDANGIPALGWDVARLVEFALALCHGVAALHEVGVIHGALKPSNVLIADDLSPLLSDPGKVSPRDPDSRIELIDAIYRAPEHLGGTGTEAPTADVYGLGQILAFLLAGGDVRGTTDAVRALRSGRNVPRGLVRIVRKATAGSPNARYQTVAELIHDLEQYSCDDVVGLPSIGPAASVLLSAPPDVSAASAKVIAARPVAAVRHEGGRGLPAQRRGVWRSIEIRAGLAGMAAGVVAMLILAATPLPTVRAAALFGVTLTASLALSTFLIKRYEPSPVLQRVTIVLLALLIHPVLDPGSLAVLRWKYTLKNGSLAERATAAARLIQSGSFDLRSADLSGASLAGVNLNEADLTNANLTGADLTEASLVEAKLTGADVREANFTGADLTASNVPNAIGFASVRCNEVTIMPEHWTCAARRPARSRQRSTAGPGSRQ